MPNPAPIIKIKRSNATTGSLGTPNIPTLVAGEFGVDQINKNLYLGLEDATGGVTSVVVGGEGTFAKKTDVSNALADGLKYKGEMVITGTHWLDTDFMGALGTQWEPPQTGFYYSVGSVTGGGVFKYGIAATEITLVEGDALVKTTTGWQRLVGGTALSEAISDLGDVFHYVGTVSAVDGTTPFDLTSVSDTDTGAYYKVNANGTYVDATTTPAFSSAAKVGDAFVKTTTGWQKLDNVDVVVSGTTDEITVTGDENAGYVVSLTTGTTGSWKDKIDTKTQNIDLTDTVAGTTQINGLIKVGEPSPSNDGYALIKGANIGIDIKDGTGTQLLHVGKWFGDSAIIGETSTLKIQSGGTDVLIQGGSNGGGATVATLVTLNSVSVSGNAAGTTTLENFVIDGGSY